MLIHLIALVLPKLCTRIRISRINIVILTLLFHITRNYYLVCQHPRRFQYVRQMTSDKIPRLWKVTFVMDGETNSANVFTCNDIRTCVSHEGQELRMLHKYTITLRLCGT